MFNVERISGPEKAVDPFLSFAQTTQDTLNRYGFGLKATQPLADCLRKIHTIGISRAVVLSLARDISGGMVFPPVLEFGVYLTSPEGHTQEVAIENLGLAHDRFAESLDADFLRTEVHVLSPDAYPPLNIEEGIESIRQRKFIGEIVHAPKLV